MRLDRPVLSLCLCNIMTTASLATAQDTAAQSTISTLSAFPSTARDLSGSIVTPSSTNSSNSTTASRTTGTNSGATTNKPITLVADGLAGASNDDTTSHSSTGKATELKKAAALGERSSPGTTPVATSTGIQVGLTTSSVSSSEDITTATTNSHTSSVVSGITDLGSRNATTSSSRTSTGTDTVTGTQTGTGALQSNTKLPSFAKKPLASLSEGVAHSTGSTLRKNAGKSGDHQKNNNTADTSFEGQGVQGDGKQQSQEVSAFPTNATAISNLGVYGYKTVTIQPSYAQADNGRKLQKQVTVVPLARPYKIAMTTISGVATSVIQWLPGAQQLDDPDKGFNSTWMPIGDKAPTLAQTVAGLAAPTTPAAAPKPQSDTQPQTTAAPAAPAPKTTTAAAPSPDLSKASDAIAALAGVLGGSASTSTQAPAPVASQETVAVPAPVASQEQQQPQEQTQEQEQQQTQAADSPAPAQAPQQTAMAVRPAAVTSAPAPIVVLNDDTSDAADSPSPVPSNNAPSNNGNGGSRNTIVPEVISSIPAPAPIIPQTQFNPQTATTVMQQQPTVAAIPAADVQVNQSPGIVNANTASNNGNTGSSNNGNTGLSNNNGGDQPIKVPTIAQTVPNNAAGSVLAAAAPSAQGQTGATSPQVQPPAAPAPAAVSIGNSAVNIQAIPVASGAAAGAASPDSFSIGTQVAQIGQTVTENNTPVVIQTNNAGAAVAMVGSSAAATLTPAAAPAPAPADSQGHDVLVVAGQTLSVGGVQTIGPVESATVVSLQTNQAGQAQVVAGSSTIPVAAFVSAFTDATIEHVAPAAPTVVPTGPLPSNVLQAGSLTLGVNMPAITLGTGASAETVSLATDTNGIAQIVAGSSTMPVASFLSAHPSFTAAQITPPPVPVSSAPASGADDSDDMAVAIGTQTFGVGEQITVGTSVLSMATDAAGMTEIIEGGTSTMGLDDFLLENPSASVVVDPIGATRAPSVSATSTSDPAFASVTIAPAPGARTDNAIVVGGTVTLEPGESITQTNGGVTQTVAYESLSDGFAIVVQDQSTTATSPLPTDFLAGSAPTSARPTTFSRDTALPTKTSAPANGSPFGSAAGWSRSQVSSHACIKIIGATLTSLLVGLALA